MKVIVCDSGPLIHLSEAGLLDLLRPDGSLFPPHGVAIEVHSAAPIAEPWPAFLQIVELEPHERKQAHTWQAAGDLHAGEAEALVLARRKKADWFLTDDAATRSCPWGATVNQGMITGFSASPWTFFKRRSAAS